MKTLTHKQFVKLVLEYRSLCENDPENLKRILRDRALLVDKRIYKNFNETVNTILDLYE